MIRKKPAPHLECGMGTRFPKDLAQTKKRDRDPIQFSRIMIWSPSSEFETAESCAKARLFLYRRRPAHRL
jgi:hypothetical protein